MATLLNISVLHYFRPLFVFLLIFVILYAILKKTEIFGKDAKTLNTIAALCISILSLFMGKLTTFISTITPWIVAVFLGVVLIFMLLMFFGVQEKEAWDYVGGKWIPVIIIFLVIFIGISQVLTLSPLMEQNQTSSDGFREEIIRTLVHPRILGALLLIIIIAVATKLIVDGIKTK